jgi:hypothetical protein
MADPKEEEKVPMRPPSKIFKPSPVPSQLYAFRVPLLEGASQTYLKTWNSLA